MTETMDWLDDDLDSWEDDLDTQEQEEQEAARELLRVLPGAVRARPPVEEIATAARRLRAAAAPGSQIASDEGLVLVTLAGALPPQDRRRWSMAERVALACLDPLDWVAAVVATTTAGVGTRIEATAVAAAVVSAREHGAPDGPMGRAVARAVAALLPRWRAAGAVDDADRLTELGAWALPEVLLRAWSAPGQIGPTR